MDRIFSGIQPTGSLHLGNYLGAIKNWVLLQERFEAFYCIVDLHALTTRPDPSALRENVIHIAKGLLACGVDPDKATLFVQSDVPQHSELAWILSCMTQLGDLNRMTQFKDKSSQQPENVNAGLFTYPVLQTADILLYRATKVPVGEDQDQHVELAREVARRFNTLYGQVFPEPQVARTDAPRVIGLDGQHKMSKSRGNDVGLLDSREVIERKIRGAMTDPKRLRRQDPGEPNDCNVFSLHRFFTQEGMRDYLANGCRTAGIGCVDCKQVLVESIERVVAPIRARAEELSRQPALLEDVLARGAAKAAAEAEKTMKQVRDRIGISRRGSPALRRE